MDSNNTAEVPPTEPGSINSSRNANLSLNAIRLYIVNEILNAPEVEITPDQDLLISGILDSLNVMRLVAHIEKQSGVTIPPEDVLIENFGSLNQIDTYLAARSV